MAGGTRIEMVFNNFGAMGAEMRVVADHICRTTAHQIEARAKLKIQNPPKTGRIYELGEQTVSFTTKGGKAVSFTARKGVASRQHQASAPGEAPATETDALVNSGYTKRLGTADYEVGFTTEYAAALEFGTPRIEPRPYLRPSVEEERAQFEARIRGLVSK